MMAATPNMDSLKSIFSASDEQASKYLHGIRWPDEINCPRCGGVRHNFVKTRSRYNCKDCRSQFGLFTGTSLLCRKMPLSTYLAAAFIFVRAPKGVSSIQLADTLGIQQGTAYRLLRDFRAAIKSDVDSIELDGVIEIDGATFGGHRRLLNTGLTGNLAEGGYSKRYGSRGVIVIAKQRLGRTIPIIVKKESEAKAELVKRIAEGSTLVSDQARAWESLKALYKMLQVNHTFSFTANGACTNNAESFFSMMRKMHNGTHHHMSFRFMPLYAAEMAWKRDMVEFGLSHKQKMDALLALLLNAPRMRFIVPDEYKRTSIDWKLAEELYAEGATSGEIGAFFNVSSRSVETKIESWFPKKKITKREDNRCGY